MTTPAPQLVTGRVYEAGGFPTEPHNVVGFPIVVHRAGDWTSASSLAIVDLLTEDGVRHFRVLVPAFDMLNVPVKSLHAMSQDALWNIADRDLLGFGALALAELAWREYREIRGRQMLDEIRLARSRRSADELMGR